MAAYGTIVLDGHQWTPAKDDLDHLLLERKSSWVSTGWKLKLSQHADRFAQSSKPATSLSTIWARENLWQRRRK